MARQLLAEALTTNWFSSNIFAADDFLHVNYARLIYNYDPSANQRGARRLSKKVC